ncbi:hypothetical protein [Streptomyces globisporus]|uniref:hypothetical protein n=1 Tax=Streptomyces globisporus TaxID=1908 RepID=UPI003460311D|nr:hypothetical protein OG838_35680 [Streptomyces globisporus]
MKPATAPTAAALTAEVLDMRRTSPVPNPLNDLARSGAISQEHLRSLVIVELRNHEPELAAYGILLSRFPQNPAATYFGRLASMVYQATPRLLDTIERMGITDEDIAAHPASLPCYAYAGTMSWIALHGSIAGAALAAWVDVDAYYTQTFALLDIIESAGIQVPEAFTTYYRNGTPDKWHRSALEVIQYGLDHGDDPREALLCGRLMDECIGEFWLAATALPQG